MFGSVHRTLDAEDLLRTRNFVGVNKSVAMMAETRPVPRSTRERHQHAARAAVQIQDEFRAVPVDETEICTNFVDIGTALENRGETRFDDDLNVQIGTMRFQQREGRRREDTIAQRAQADHGNARIPRQTFQQ